jgi:hypothetical protein
VLAEGWGWSGSISPASIEGCVSERVRATQRKFTAKENGAWPLDAEIERTTAGLKTWKTAKRRRTLE